MKKIPFSAPSTDNIHQLRGVVYLPCSEPKGFFHVVHGMTEHMARYDRFMTDMADKGYICFGYDHLGHGLTALDDSELGYIAPQNGWDILCRDVRAFSDAVIAEYTPDGQALPYFLMGHSMGSFIARIAAVRYVKPDRCIIMGTGGKNPAADAGLALVSVFKKLFGERHISKLLDKIAFGSYNNRFGGGTEDDPSPWLTRDEEVRRKYYADKFCTFKFTVSAMGDLIRLIKESNSSSWYGAVPADMPILLVSGAQDPVGNYGKGVQEVADGLKAAGANARCLIYHDARHEILNDTTYTRTRDDILGFIEE